MRLRLLCLISLAFLAACGERVSSDSDARILMMGDSMLATHRGTGQSVGDGLEDLLGEEVIDRSVPGARMIYVFPLSGSAGMRIAAQYRAHPWDWVVLNGGGNDLLFGCACALCETRLERMISEDGRTGVIPELVAALRAGGASVVYPGYLRSPGRWSLIDGCRDIGDRFERRLARLADHDPGVTHVSLSDLVPEGDRSYHGPDLIHPSPKGSRAIAERIASVIGAETVAVPRP